MIANRYGVFELMPSFSLIGSNMYVLRVKPKFKLSRIIGLMRYTLLKVYK